MLKRGEYDGNIGYELKDASVEETCMKASRVLFSVPTVADAAQEQNIWAEPSSVLILVDWGLPFAS